MPNYIRVKQINQGELTGFFVDSISSQSGLLLAFASGAANNVASGIILNETVLLTGNQNISGNKTFLNNLNVSGDLTIAGTLRYNEIIDTTVTGSISGYTGIFSQVYANNLVYNTGDQTISGNKTFATQIIAPNLIYNTGNQTISGDKTFEDNVNISGDLTLNGGLYINDVEELNLAGAKIYADNLVYNTGDQTISGDKTFSNNLNVSGDLTVAGTLRYNEIIDTTVTGNISGYTGIFTQVFADNLVYNTGNQNISGDKTFEDNINISGDLTLNGGLYINDIEELNLAGAKIYADNLVYNTGNQTISGIKTVSDYIQLTNQNDGIRFNNNGSIYSTSIVGNESGITLTTFQQPTDIVRRNNFIGGNTDEVISIANTNTSNIFGQSINGISDQIVIYSTGLIFGVPSSKGPYLRLGDNNIISEKSASKLGIGTLFPSEKVHISGGNLRVQGNVIADNLVYNTGNQTISGTKNFQNTIQFSGQDILVAPADYIYITGNQTSIINGTKYLADTTSASFGFNLPASPTTGDYLEFLDPFYTWSGNNFILSGNGNNIESDAVFTGDIEGASIRTIYVGKTYGWRVKYNI